MMKQINRENGGIDLSIDIFRNNYHKKISPPIGFEPIRHGQTRLLNARLFFFHTGVVEGAVGTEKNH